MRKWMITVVFALALAGLFYLARFDGPTDATVTETASEPQQLGTGRPRIAAAIEPLVGITYENLSPRLPPIFIEWREPPERAFPFPSGTPLENYNYYRQLAESGNGFAAYKLASMMGSCNHAFRTREELDTAIEQMRETFTYFNPALEVTVHLADSSEVDISIEGEVRRFEYCSSFTTEQRQEHEYWMEVAANNGHTTAMLDYGRQLDDPLAAIELYRSAWHQGDANALLSLATGLQDTYDRGIDPTAKIPAYAARDAFVKLLNSAYGANPERIVGRWTLRNQAELNEMARAMRPEELEQAEQLSRQMITSNPNCCFQM